jgi:hypothetical protein
MSLAKYPVEGSRTDVIAFVAVSRNPLPADEPVTVGEPRKLKTWLSWLLEASSMVVGSKDSTPVVLKEKPRPVSEVYPELPGLPLE